MDWIGPVADVVATLAVIAGIWFAYQQLKQISASLALTHQANTVNVVAHCASRYEKVISEMPQTISDPNVDNWWYRYWDLYTEEFTFFQKAMLDPDIFELWINELATVYTAPPAPDFEPRNVRHKSYLQSTLPNYKLLHCFFDELQRIACSEDGSAEDRAWKVHCLVKRTTVDVNEGIRPNMAMQLTKTTDHCKESKTHKNGIDDT